MKTVLIVLIFIVTLSLTACMENRYPVENEAVDVSGEEKVDKQEKSEAIDSKEEEVKKTPAETPVDSKTIDSDSNLPIDGGALPEEGGIKAEIPEEEKKAEEKMEEKTDSSTESVPPTDQ